MPRYAFLSTLAALFLVAASPAAAAELGSRQLRLGSHGSDVRQLQRALDRLGFDLVSDGDFGPLTDRSVRRYEKKHHLKVDGVVGSREARSIASAALRAAAGGSVPETGGVAPPAPPSDDPPPPVDPPPATSGHAFPVDGAFGFGGDGARFGAPRAGHVHQGQDVTAAEGTPLVAVSDGVVYWRAYQAGGAGNYVVISGSDGRDYVYMHLREGSLVKQGETVHAGELVGHVGSTGDASGPHLHFEVWTGGHWQGGGHPIDPLPLLQSWL